MLEEGGLQGTKRACEDMLAGFASPCTVQCGLGACRVDRLHEFGDTVLQTPAPASLDRAALRGQHLCLPCHQGSHQSRRLEKSPPAQHHSQILHLYHLVILFPLPRDSYIATPLKKSSTFQPATSFLKQITTPAKTLLLNCRPPHNFEIHHTMLNELSVDPLASLSDHRYHKGKDYTLFRTLIHTPPIATTVPFTQKLFNID